MYPLLVDLSRVPALLAGDGAAAARRLAQLDEAGARRLRIFSAAPDPTLEALAGSRLERRLPSADEIAAVRLLFIADLPDDLTVPGEGPLEGTPTRRPRPPRGIAQRRLTRTAERRSRRSRPRSRSGGRSCATPGAGGSSSSKPYVRE